MVSKVCSLFSTGELEVEDQDRELYSGKLSEFQRIISEDLGKGDKNKKLLIHRDNWLGHDFVFRSHKKLIEGKHFVFFNGLSSDTLDLPYFTLMIHSFDNDTWIHENQTGSISCQGLKTFLSQATPVGIFSVDHYFLAEIKGRLFTNLHFQ
jgi:hypothetical protein